MVIELFNFSFFTVTGWGIDLDSCVIEWFALETNRDHSVIFEIISKYCILDSFVDYDGYSISSKGFLPTVRVKVKLLSHFRLFATPWTVAYQASLSMGFSRQEYWNGLPFPSLGDLPDPGIEPRSPTLQADSLPSEPPGKLRWQ